MERYGKYLLLQQLGRGGMAEVFLAKADGPMGVSRHVALKRVLPELSSDFSDMFLDEAQVSVALSHPAVVTVYDFGHEAGCYYLAMEYVEGVDLNQLIQKSIALKKPIPIECTLYIISQIARGLDHAHKLTDAQDRPLKIVHRDISPSNVLVSFAGDVKISDFGIAKAAKRVKQYETAAGIVKGKLPYMSPEQARGAALDHRSDIFSVGTLMLETLIAHPVYHRVPDPEMWKLVQQGVPPERAQFAARIPQDVAKLLDRVMAPDRDRRIADAGDLADALEVLLRMRDPIFNVTSFRRYLDTLFSEEKSDRRRALMAFDLLSSNEGLPAGAAHSLNTVALHELDDDAPAPSAPKADNGTLSREIANLRAGSKGSFPWKIGAGVAGIVAVLAVWMSTRPAAIPPPVVAPSPSPTPVPTPAPVTALPSPSMSPLPSPSASPSPSPVSHKSGFGTLTLTSNPWAIVTIDGRPTGRTTPIKGLRLPAGNHRVELSNPGFPTTKVWVTVPADGAVDKRVTLGK